MRYSERVSHLPYMLVARARYLIAGHIKELEANVDKPNTVNFSRAPIAEFVKRFDCWHGFRGISRTATLRSRKRMK